MKLIKNNNPGIWIFDTYYNVYQIVGKTEKAAVYELPTKGDDLELALEILNEKDSSILAVYQKLAGYIKVMSSEYDDFLSDFCGRFIHKLNFNECTYYEEKNYLGEVYCEQCRIIAENISWDDCGKLIIDEALCRSKSVIPHKSPEKIGMIQVNKSKNYPFKPTSELVYKFERFSVVGRPESILVLDGPSELLYSISNSLLNIMLNKVFSFGTSNVENQNEINRDNVVEESFHIDGMHHYVVTKRGDKLFRVKLNDKDWSVIEVNTLPIWSILTRLFPNKISFNGYDLYIGTRHFKIRGES